MVSCPLPLSPCDHVCDDWCRWHVWCDDDAMVFISGLTSDDVRYRGSGSWRVSGHLVTPCVISLINAPENHVFTPTYTNMNTRHSQQRWNRGSNFHPSVAIYLNGRVALRLRWYITSPLRLRTRAVSCNVYNTMISPKLYDHKSNGQFLCLSAVSMIGRHNKSQI